MYGTKLGVLRRDISPPPLWARPYGPHEALRSCRKGNEEDDKEEDMFQNGGHNSGCIHAGL